ncbi:hypothetical protein QEN19_003801 [Hanseniaspora menglaensis]
MSSSEINFVSDYYNSTFNPKNVFLTYESIFSLETTTTFEELQNWVENKIKYAIIYGTRIGAAGIALLVLAIVTKNKKSPIFVINMFSLLFIILQSGVYLKYLRSNYASVTYSFTYFEQMVKRSDIYTTGAANMLEVFLVFFVELSLVFQIYTLFKNNDQKRIGQTCVALSMSIGLATTALFFASAVKNIILVYQSTGSTGDTRLYNAAVICLASSINFMTVLLCFKLIQAIRSRRFLGLKQFDTFHILLIMSFQSLIIPSILYILAYALSAKHGSQSLQAISTLIIVVSLPLSSMWAGSSNSTSNINTINPNFANSPRYDQESFYSQSYQSAIKSRKQKEVNFKAYTESVANNDVTSNISSYMDQPVETPVDKITFDNLKSKNHADDIDFEFQQYLMHQTISNCSQADKFIHTKAIIKNEDY